ncbi:Serine/threonine-protein kinase ENV7 [Wickerhamiella sorbophila]|uniref:non-specific serine/threonine protein kinase n=1 Tax=Wickerhamiella sorbophila TaxID=45607 RepID=A0A2T0FN84_9ASCO|nr:Serine/threonine-protein kinase ENV7 [Wickerhamiella sorbophila]PRT56451.1 Serine/threonine-protein kinase ENV7 [Wickerhamiella sorbophila]
MNDFWAAVQACFSCFQAPSLVLNGRRLSVTKLLGEGGFAYVYLVEDQRSHEVYALKKIRCPFGAESVATVMREVNACKRFRNTLLVISSVDSMVKQDEDGTKTVYLLLPYYGKGSLQDLINDNAINNQSFSEPEVLKYALGTAEAIRAMHHHHASGSGGHDDGEAEEDRLLDNQDDSGRSSVPLGEVVPYAHRDVKPANVMIDDHQRLVLMDLGSVSKARVHVENRQQALEIQDEAAELCTLPYRAPELLNVRPGTTIDERVDVWSLGCTIYALMYSISPFERAERDTGASLNLAISNRKLDFPPTPNYSQDLKDLVANCLTMDCADRPTIDQVISQIQQLL